MLDTHTPRTSARPGLGLAAVSAAPEAIAFAAANSWIRAALQCRFNINPLFEAAGVDVSANGIPRIRKAALVQLMQQCVLQAAPAFHYPLVMGDLFAFDHLPALETFLATSPTLRQAMPALAWAAKALPSLSLHVEEGPEVSALVVSMDLPTDNPRVRGFFVEGALAGINKFVRLAIGDSHEALHIEVEHDPGPQSLACESQFKLPIRVNQARNAVVFQSSLLDRPLPGSVPGLHQRAQELIAQQLPAEEPDSITAQLEGIFRRHPSLLGQGIERMAERLTLHPRTLQRRLHAEGQVFADIQARCRHDIAVVTLKEGRVDIEALSEQLGFSDRHSFTRAFRRWTGLAPSEYRRQHQAHGLPRHAPPNPDLTARPAPTRT
jgi:AraC-like DNA-binding protein